MSKANNFFLVLLILLSIGSTGLPAISKVNNQALSVVRLTEVDSGKQITIRKGVSIVLSLANQPDGGYILDSIKYNNSILRLVNHVQKSPAANIRLGQPGKALWEFIALKGGNSIIRVTATRPWNKKDFITVFSAILKIK